MTATAASLVFVICGPSGVGKTTLIQGLRERDPSLRFSVSMTTRLPRRGEVDGADYYFVTAAEFEHAVAHDELLEHATVHGQSYGTPRSEIDKARAAGQDLILDIDIQGARQVKAKSVPAEFIFISPPAPEVLAERLRARATESPADFAVRLATAQSELNQRPWFQHEVINDDLDSALVALQHIIRTERRRAGR